MLKIIFALAMFIFSGAAYGQAQPKLTNPQPVLITTGNTFQQLYPLSAGRLSLTLQNNNASDACNIIVGGPWKAGDTTSTSRTINGTSMTGAQASILLAGGGTGVYSRYYPYVPSDQILVTCATTGDSFYADTQ